MAGRTLEAHARAFYHRETSAAKTLLFYVGRLDLAAC